MKHNKFKEVFYKVGEILEPKSCKILLLMFGISDDNGNVSTSLTDLEKRSGMSISTIRRALKELENKRILTITLKAGMNTDYKLNLNDGLL